MSQVWITSAAIRASGPVLLGGRELPAAVRGVTALVAPALLAALVVVETLGAPEGGALDLDARVAGVGAAGAVLALRGSALPAVAAAAIVTAVLRAIA